ncbi:hypothetical protein GH714_037591 [Hevea brasiliensis]|uniref:Uncharacterized protein n=1 Tax=Hevea brasiliensis TaxID=3981 RepID=A0A6A6LQZ2_HEVBR|nr:hypothetical protein GH714_037591 [Hevea brasiliensis]
MVDGVLDIIGNDVNEDSPYSGNITVGGRPLSGNGDLILSFQFTFTFTFNLHDLIQNTGGVIRLLHWKKKLHLGLTSNGDWEIGKIISTSGLNLLFRCMMGK